MLFTYELARRLAATRQLDTANTLHPGVVSTDFGAEDPGTLQRLFVPLLRPLMKTPAQGAATSVFVAAATRTRSRDRAVLRQQRCEAVRTAQLRRGGRGPPVADQRRTRGPGSRRQIRRLTRTTVRRASNGPTVGREGTDTATRVDCSGLFRGRWRDCVSVTCGARLHSACEKITWSTIFRNPKAKLCRVLQFHWHNSNVCMSMLPVSRWSIHQAGASSAENAPGS